MLKHSALALAIASSLVFVTGCDKKEKTETVINATTPTSSTASTTVSTASVPTVTTVDATTASAPAVVASSTTVTTTTTTTTASAAAPAAALATPVAATAKDRNTALKADLTHLFKTLNELDRKTEAKQAEMAKKMQNAKTPADQAAFFKEVVAQLDAQKATLNSLKFNDPRVGKARDKMVESITNSRAGTQALIKTPNATPETNPEIAKNMQGAQKAAEEARGMLMKLAEEAGVKPTQPQGQANKQ